MIFGSPEQRERELMSQAAGESRGLFGRLFGSGPTSELLKKRRRQQVDVFRQQRRKLYEQNRQQRREMLRKMERQKEDIERYYDVGYYRRRVAVASNPLERERAQKQLSYAEKKAAEKFAEVRKTRERAFDRGYREQKRDLRRQHRSALRDISEQVQKQIRQQRQAQSLRARPAPWSTQLPGSGPPSPGSGGFSSPRRV